MLISKGQVQDMVIGTGSGSVTVTGIGAVTVTVTVMDTQLGRTINKRVRALKL
jgi:hypothetical protein